MVFSQASRVRLIFQMSVTQEFLIKLMDWSEIWYSQTPDHLQIRSERVAFFLFSCPKRLSRCRRAAGETSDALHDASRKHARKMMKMKMRMIWGGFAAGMIYDDGQMIFRSVLLLFAECDEDDVYVLWWRCSRSVDCDEEDVCGVWMKMMFMVTGAVLVLVRRSVWRFCWGILHNSLSHTVTADELYY